MQLQPQQYLVALALALAPGQQPSIRYGFARSGKVQSSLYIVFTTSPNPNKRPSSYFEHVIASRHGGAGSQWAD